MQKINEVKNSCSSFKRTSYLAPFDILVEKKQKTKFVGLAGVLEDIQKDFNVGDDKGGLLQTAFVMSYMIFAPLFGYLGDRYSRRGIMAFGVFLWGLTTLLGSFMQVCKKN